jgi:hypothetical protein
MGSRGWVVGRDSRVFHDGDADSSCRSSSFVFLVAGFDPPCLARGPASNATGGTRVGGGFGMEREHTIVDSSVFGLVPKADFTATGECTRDSAGGGSRRRRRQQ